MAPSNMFSYLRHHNKRNASNPASPDPLSLNASIPQLPVPSPSLHSTEFLASPRVTDNASFNSGSPVSPYPPQLPPIPRVASRLDRSGANSAVTSPQPPTSAQSNNTVASTAASTTDGAENRGIRPGSQPQSSSDHLSPGYDSRRPSSRRTESSPSSSGFWSKGHSLAEVVEHVVHDSHSSQPSSQLAPPTIGTHYSANSRSQTSLISGISDKFSTTTKSSNATPAPPKSGKSRMTLRNPMSLLMRRRSGQTLENLSDEAIVTHRSPSIVPPMPDDYDPSIRGRIFHDFSAPRPNRNFSYNNAYGTDQSTAAPDQAPGECDRSSPVKVEREHTPVFREHFDDDTSYEASQSAIRAEKLANKDFVARNSWLPPPDRSPPPPPPKDSPPGPPPQRSAPSPPVSPPEQTPEVFESSILSPVQEAPSPTDAPAEETPRKRKSTKTPPSSRSRATSVTDPNFVPAGLPAHLTSRSSRFSFQISGNDSAQERLLEERHKQKAAEKASKQTRMSTQTLEDDYDDYGMDDFDMDDGFEEDIPMLGDDDGYGDSSYMSPGMGAFDFSSITMPVNNNPMSPISMNGEPDTPRDASGNPIGFALSGDVLQNVHLPAPGRHLNGSELPITEMRGLGIMDVQHAPGDLSNFTPADTPEDTNNATSNLSNTGALDMDDDMYFDDGMIEEQGDIEAVEFDENVFDDPSHPLFERKMKPPPVEDFQNGPSSHPLEASTSETGYEADDDDLTRHLNKTEPSLAHKTSTAAQKPVPDFSNLEAYHNALADAANRAEAQGRFARKDSVDVGHHSSDADESSLSNSRPSLVPDDGRYSLETAGFPPDDDGFGMDTSFMDDYDYSEYDSALEDDPMIAAANAEALASEYGDFYGQEFGFYANAQGEAVNAYGGFFGQSNLGRAASGRNAVREPNLTPITERSEYSTRNSFISLNHFRDGQQPIQSPGLAQLARISPYGWRDDDPDMSLDSLMKLRKGAFGGSRVSLGSSTGNSPRNSSPMGMQYGGTGSPMANYSRQSEEVGDSDDSVPIVDDEYADDDEALDAINAVPGEYSDSEVEEEDQEQRLESPTLTASDYNSFSNPTHQSGHDSMPPRLPSQAKFGSSPPPLTDSVAYVREHDEQGGDRWVLERRRTAESGELELIGREIVEGGRI
ncbi:hypothetical protein BCR34DRAFT_536417 [Clohesyomyces aquaticus]|uniref:Uncharacterized protein n=1 Tax=Clohesyomyces aquaticus TaxID=1231657 RepID=A0A1Y1ZRE9_9PLEO|nr:hypothetical protein BCR34DRAFT_536417 [Clohesyomyces aquaticus]